MKTSALAWLLALPLSLALSAEELPDHRALTVAAVAMEDGLDPAEHAGDWLRLYMPELHARLEAGDVEEAEARRLALEDLKQRASEFPVEEPLTVKASVYLHPYDEASESFPLGALFHGHYFVAHATQAQTLPTAYQVLVANTDLAGALPMTPEKAAAFRERRQKLHGTLRRRAYATAELRLVAFQNGRDFQAALTRVDIYDDPERRDRLHRFEASACPDRIVSDRLLSEGVTWDMVENHGFEYLGIRFLAVFPENHPEMEDCGKEGRVAGHRVIRCAMDARIGRMPVRMDRFYVGGRLARVVVHRTEPPAEGHRRIVGHSLRRAGLAGTPPTDEPVSWRYQQVALRYDPTVLAPDAKPEPTAFLEISAMPYLKLTDGELAPADAQQQGES